MAKSLVLFILLLAGGLHAEPLRLVVISDLNSSYGSTSYPATVAAAVERILEIRPDAVLITGDMVAGQRPADLLTRDELNTMWDAFDRVVAWPLRKAGIPLLAVPGNHDASAEARFHREREAYDHYWGKRPPELTKVSESTPFQWAYRLRNLLLIGLDATRHGPLRPAAQRQWLEAVLKTNAGSANQVILVAGHLPIWAFAKHRERGILKDPGLEKMLRENGVDAYLSGHHHAYFPALRNGLLQISIGALGSGRRALIGTHHKSPASFLLLEIQPNGEFRYTALRGKRFRQTIEPGDLPEKIRSREALLLRAGG